MGGKASDRCPNCGASPTHQRPELVQKDSVRPLLTDLSKIPSMDNLGRLMLEHPELPVLLMGCEDDSPCCYVDMLRGRGHVGFVAEYGDRLWDDLDEMEESMREDGCGDADVAVALWRAKPCIWAEWEHFQGVDR